MRDLAAQVTSSLLRFPAVTVEALGEDEVTLDSVLHGKFTAGRSVLAWLACGPHLEVVHAATGERFSAYRFSGVTDHLQPSVTAVREFGWLKRSGLLVGLQEDESSMLCLYDLGISRVIKAVVIPNRITAIEPLVSYGGASTSTQHLHQSLRWFFGVVAVVTDVGHVLLVDLCLDDFSCTQTELEASDLEVVNKCPSDIPRLREGVTQQGRHLCLQLCSSTGTGVSALHFISRTNQLAVGFTDGFLQLWNMKTLKKEYHSQLEGGRVPVYAFNFQEPENDPRNCCYLWAVQSAQDLEGDVVSLHLLQLAFGERKCSASGKIIYEGLEYCEERYSQDLSGGVFPLRAQATHTRLLSCQTIEKFRHHPDREDSVNEVASPDTSVSVFSWQVKSYGQGQPSTFIGLFDINRWYHAQMPDSLRAGESLQNCPYLAVWSLDSVVEVTQSCPLLDVVVHERSLSRALPHTCPPPEQFYNPNTYNFEASCLLNAGIVHFTCSGYQKETLSYLKKAVPSLSDGISNGYSRCLMSGLLSSRLADVQPSSLTEQEQLDAILTTAVETSALGLITGCIKQWTTEEQAGSAVNLRYILEWAWDKVVKTKEELDGICAPLFDSSSNFTDPQTLQLLQHSQRLLSNLSTIFHCLLNEAQELTQRGVIGLVNKCMVSSLISQYAQVVLWFCRTGLLPESADDDVLQISRPFYSFSVIKNYYTGQREELHRLAKDKWNADCLMIDGLVAQCGERLSELWTRDQGGTGQYPPPSLHALLDLYLLENVEESTKHAIVIYLLLDVMYSFPNKSGASVESFPTAFSIPIGLVKLVQGLWLLDHHDHENSLDLLLHPSVSPCVWAWQHSRVLQALMIQNKHSTALHYLHMMKPSITSTCFTKLCVSVLLHNRCIVEAWALLRQQVNKLSMDELLRFFYETCQELGLMKELLKLPLQPSEQECLERFLQETGGFQNRELLMVHYLQQANYVPALQINHTLKMNLAGDRDPKMKERSNTRNSIMTQYGKVLPRAQRKLAIERAKPYQHPSTVLREVTRPQPLSTVAKRSTTENVLSRAAFIKNVLTKIEEVWIGKDTTPEPSPLKSPKAADALVSSPNPPTLNVPEAFVGTPINMLTKRMSRLLDLAVQPSSHATPDASHTQATPSRSVSSWAAPKHISRAPELSLLHTPQVVKRARALAASGPVFSSFTPQSILRSSLRPTPIATPTASPARSATPPLRPKESRITFVEDSESPDLPKSPSLHWSNGLTAVDEISELKRPPLPPEGGVEGWSEHSGEEEEDEREPSVALTPSLEQKESVETEEPTQVLPTLERRPSLGHETSALSVQSDSTLEFHDAPSPADVMRPAWQSNSRLDEEDEVVIVRRPESDTDIRLLCAEEPIVNQEMENDDVSEFEMQPDAQEHAKEDTEERSEESTAEREVQNTPVVPVASLEESDQDDSMNHEVVLAPREPIRTSGTSEEPIRAEEIKDLEPAPLPITDDAVTAEEPIRESPEESESRESVEHSVVNNEPIGELPAFDSDAVSEELKEKPEAMETSDLDDYVERQLFGDLSPPHSHADSKEALEVNSEPCGDVKDLGAEDDTHKSVASSEAATSESRSVVSLNDTEELSSSDEDEEEIGEEEEEEENAEGEEEEEEEEEEDSGSEVEIIEEVKGNGTQQHLYLQDLQPEDQFLQEQAAAVLSLVSDPQLKVVDGCEEEEGQVVVVGLRPASLDDEGDVCYTELKPSTTLLVPIELAAEHQELLHGAELPEVALPLSSNNFSLMLEADDEEPAALEMDAENHLTLQENTEHAGDMEEEPNANRDDVSVEHAVLEPEEMFRMEEIPSETVVPDDVEPNKVYLIEEVQMEQEVTESEPNVEDQPGEPAEEVQKQSKSEAVAEPEPLIEDQPDQSADEAQAEQTEEKMERIPDSAIEAQTAEEPEEKPVEPSREPVEKPVETAEEPMEEPVKEPVIEETFDVTDICVTGQVQDSGLTEVKEDGLVHNEKMAVEDVVESSELVPVAEDHVSEANRAELKEVQQSPARRGRKTVTFPVTVMEPEKDASEEERADSKVPSTPRRVTRSGKQLLESEVLITPRRSTRKTDSEVIVEEVPSTKATPPRKTPQKATPRRGARKTRSSSANDDVEEVQNMEETSIVEHQSARKTRKVATIEVPEPIPEEKPAENQANTNASPGRVTRQSSRRLSLTLENFQMVSDVQNASLVTPPRSRRKTRGTTEEKANNETYIVDSAQLQNVSRRLTRSRHWNDGEELEKPENLESTNLLESALMERLNNDQAKESEVVTEIVRAKRRTRSVAPAVDHEEQNAEAPESALSTEQQEQKKKSAPSVRRTRASKAPEPDTSPVSDGASGAQRARGKKKDVAVNDVVLSPPVTRMRRATAVPDSRLQILSDEAEAEAEAEVKTRKKRTTRARAEPEPVTVELLSPLASPAEPVQRKKPADREAAAPKMNLRRRRMMEAIFPKPVTRRKKL
ncbi:protein ELYS isoform X2 [Pangasianodon hypophthalmus]|uniref:protein ELYS isoform X2 n=1 Tax=Pangasianodon hypophthalmus TaxID=310915 RepID=UPI0023071197|nr:protein ELYS isoform X2 [Pangasianodon hypophthalmus]